MGTLQSMGPSTLDLKSSDTIINNLCYVILFFKIFLKFGKYTRKSRETSQRLVERSRENIYAFMYIDFTYNIYIHTVKEEGG